MPIATAARCHSRDPSDHDGVDRAHRHETELDYRDGYRKLHEHPQVPPHRLICRERDTGGVSPHHPTRPSLERLTFSLRRALPSESAIESDRVQQIFVVVIAGVLE